MKQMGHNMPDGQTPGMMPMPMEPTPNQPISIDFHGTSDHTKPSTVDGKLDDIQ